MKSEAEELNRVLERRIAELKLEISRLKGREEKLKNILLPVCEYAAEIYNSGASTGEFPNDTIQRLNSALKFFGG